MSRYFANRDVNVRNYLLEKMYEELVEELKKDYLNTYNKLSTQVEKLFLELMSKGTDKVLVSHLYQYKRFYSLMNNVNTELQKLGIKQKNIFDKKFTELYERVSKSVQNQLGFSTKIDTNEVKLAIESVWVPDGLAWSDRIWKDKEALASLLQEGLVECVASGKSSSQLAKTIQEKFNVSWHNAQRLAVTELAHIEIQSTIDNYKKYGVTHYKVITARDDDVCDDDKELDGKIFPIDDTEHLPPFHPNCRCTISASKGA